jgi:Protein of unknown function (DUF3048) N-terminal domain/Protein of unknown function (DUF3048) C-terminal domain/Abnormal spindle-like microcephaly-assoc'd, ASPM-SPD-2-Hydin
MRRVHSFGGAAVAAIGSACAAVITVPAAVEAVDTDMAISTTAIDFGQVNVGSTAQAAVTLTNTGGDPFGPINMFGGAPPTAEFDASQNCQGNTLAAGGSCMVNYEFSPGSAGTFNDTSSFTVSETNNQGDGEDFSVSLSGVGFDPNATTTTSSTSTSTTSTTTTTTAPTGSTTTPSTPTAPNAPGPTAATSGDNEPLTPTTVAATTTSTVATWPLTGLLNTPRPALVVKIDNVDAEPQSGLNQADVVFEEIVEGSQTRFAAVFNSMEANPVGPIRSARTQDVDLLLSLNDPAIAYSGANEAVNEALQAAGFELLGEGTPGFFRRDDLAEPHNLYANLSALWPQLTSSANAVPAFQYLGPGQSVAGTPITFAAMMVGSYDVRWDWDPTQGLFVRSQLGSPHELTDAQASANNVVVLVLDYGTSPAGGPEAQTLGSGAAVVYSDGHKIEGTWTRADPTDPFLLEAAGQPILLAPGRTWVELVDEQHNLTDG